MTGRRWTKQKVIEAIQDRHRRGLSLTSVWRDDKLLFAAAYRHLGSWHKAMLAAGFPSKPRRRWSRQRVIEEIQKRYLSGLPLVNVRADDAGLGVAAVQHFGNWNEALVAAGFRTKPAWTKQRVVDSIRARVEQGLSLTNMRQEDGQLYRAAWRTFGGWYAALAAAGVQAQRPRRWTKQRILDKIRLAYRQGVLHTLRQQDRSFGNSAIRRFGSWHAALRAAGVPLYRRRWSKRAVIEALQSRQQMGASISQTWKEDPILFATAKRYFDSWRAALLAAGLQSSRQSWSKQRILETIQDRHARGESLKDLRNDNALSSAAQIYFGGLNNALRAAGIDPKALRRWSRQSVIAEIRARHDQGLPLLTTCREIHALTSAAIRLFGGWREALIAAGVEPNQRRWSEVRVVEEIQRRSRAFESGDRFQLDPRVYVLARKHFGSWQNALKTVGVEPPRKWSKRRVVEAIQDSYVKGMLDARDPNLVAAAKRCFGSWREALSVAGVRNAERVGKNRGRTP